MKCPHCEYENGWNGDESVEGKKGEFYQLPIDLKREANYDRDEVSLLACPACKKTFID